MRLAAFVAGGPIALSALDALAAIHEVVVIVQASPTRPFRSAWRSPAKRLARALSVLPADPIAEWARRAGTPIVESVAGQEQRTAERVASYAPDYGCIATYPRRIGALLLGAAGRECVNLHPSLLPRHRGPNPLFWTYLAGDHDGGVSVHIATSRIDAGPVLLRESFGIARGESIITVHSRCATLGGPLLANAISHLAAGTAIREDQDEFAATHASHVTKGTLYSDLATWTAAHAWHFLAGLVPRYREPFVDTKGKAVRYSRVDGFEERTPRSAPGTVVPDGRGWMAWTRDGVVHLSRGTLPASSP